MPDENGIQHRNPVDEQGYAMMPHVITLDTSLSHGACRMYCILLKYAQQKGKCWPGIERLAKDLNKTADTVSRYLSELVDRGLITRERRMGHSTMTWIEDVREVYGKMPGRISEKSYNHHQEKSQVEEEQVEEEQISSGPKIRFTRGKKEKSRISDARPTPLAPSTPGAEFMLEKLGAEAQAKGRNPPQRFGSLVQKEIFEDAEDRVGEEKVKEFVTKALAVPILSIKGVTAYVRKCAEEKPRAKAGEILDAGGWCEGMPPRLKAGETLVITGPGIQGG